MSSDERRRCNDELLDTTAKMTELQRAIDVRASARGNLTSLERERARLAEALEEADAALAGLDARVNNLRAHMAEQQALCAEIADYDAVDTVWHVLLLRETPGRTARDARAAIGRLAADLEPVLREAEQRTGERRDLDGKLAVCTTALAKARATLREVASLESELRFTQEAYQAAQERLLNLDRAAAAPFVPQPEPPLQGPYYRGAEGLSDLYGWEPPASGGPGKR